jgi:hypothetical protein
MRQALALAALGLALAASALAQPLGRLDPGATAPGFSAAGADGRRHALADYAGRILVLEWTSPVCPYTAAKYRSGAIQGLQREARRVGAAWLTIDTAPPGRPGHLTPAAARARIARLGANPSAFLFDETGSVGRLYGAKVTPSFFIIGRNGRLAFEGAMDDEEPSKTGAPRNYVAEALQDLAAGQSVRTPEAPVYGCAVEY